jgi:elongation factor Ts
MADAPRVSAGQVKALRDRTGAGMMDAKAALEEAGGDEDKAIEILRVKGQAKAAKRGGREAAEGVVQSYIHANGKVGVLVEVDCETDFVARNPDFVEFAREVALHVAGTPSVQWVSEEEVPDDAREAELRVLGEQAAQEGGDKPPEVQRKIAEGRLGKWLDDVVLLRQQHVNVDKHEQRTLEELRAELSSKTGENVVIRRFVRFAVGEA